jgi:FkbM family methyltransferase
MKLSKYIRKIVRLFGIDLVRFASTPDARRATMLRHFDIDLIVDVGANSGQYAQSTRYDLGYRGKIVSFEPMSAVFSVLERISRPDKQWDVYQYALGDENDYQTINISENSHSSSLLSMLDSHLNAAPQSIYIGSETIQVKTLDSVFEDLCSESKNIFLKIDTQGYESKVLKGAENVLDNIHTIQLEMALVPLYDGELIFVDMCQYLQEKGYTLIGLEPGFGDNVSGQLLQVDGIFHRS